MRLRSATVEPVLGTLLNFRRMRKVYTIGQELARKQLLMAAAAYNLKKLMGAMGLRKVATAVSAAKEAIWKNWNMAQFIFGWHKFSFVLISA